MVVATSDVSMDIQYAVHTVSFFSVPTLLCIPPLFMLFTVFFRASSDQIGGLFGDTSERLH